MDVFGLACLLQSRGIPCTISVAEFPESEDDEVLITGTPYYIQVDSNGNRYFMVWKTDGRKEHLIQDCENGGTAAQCVEYALMKEG